MKITGIEMFPISMAFVRKVKTAFRGTGIDEGISEDNVVIKIYTDEGISGLGEAGTWGIYYCGESQETVMDVIAYYLFSKGVTRRKSIQYRFDPHKDGRGCNRQYRGQISY